MAETTTLSDSALPGRRETRAPEEEGGTKEEGGAMVGV
eukprot:CAMPEP_0113577414 /NCGR_PEP_ID=MMETSP0015_2-20120614/28868_1 /TAXON_ID=2838 /ORGANISM="Odontella" /LENGTH=37 /DNA_ID=CAMNT_0000481017 /DNA_START=102 /DNA_END=215 /DNA_ORIENTATION=+ /assembly_acc=CAM_ASM_000160